MSSPPPPIRTSAYGDETEGEGSPLLPRRSSGAVGGGDGGATSEATASTGGEEGGYHSGHLRGSGLVDRLTMTTTATEMSGGGGGGGRDASVMRALWASSGYHSDSAIPSSTGGMHRARREGSREMLDAA